MRLVAPGKLFPICVSVANNAVGSDHSDAERGIAVIIFQKKKNYNNDNHNQVDYSTLE